MIPAQTTSAIRPLRSVLIVADPPRRRYARDMKCQELAVRRSELGVRNTIADPFSAGVPESDARRPALRLLAVRTLFALLFRPTPLAAADDPGETRRAACRSSISRFAKPHTGNCAQLGAIAPRRSKRPSTAKTSNSGFAAHALKDIRRDGLLDASEDDVRARRARGQAGVH